MHIQPPRHAAVWGYSDENCGINPYGDPHPPRQHEHLEPRLDKPKPSLPPPYRTKRDLFDLPPYRQSLAPSRLADFKDVEFGRVRRPKRSHKRTASYVAILALPFLLISLMACGLLQLARARKSQISKRSLDDLEHATLNHRPAWTSHPAFLAGIITGFLVAFALITSWALVIRKRRDAKYAAADASTYATQLHIHEKFPRLVSAFHAATRPLHAAASAAKPFVPAALVRWADDWLHSSRDDDAVKSERRADIALRELSAGLPLHIVRGHDASASAPDLLARVPTGTGSAGGDAERADGAAADEMPQVTGAEMAAERGCKSMPSSLRGASPAPEERLTPIEEEGAMETLDRLRTGSSSSRPRFLDLYLARDGNSEV